MALNKTVTTQSTPLGYNKARPDFIKNEFDIVLYQKGYNVIHEKALKCPCKAKNEGGQLSSCQNCGGVGWVFINSQNTQMIIHSMNINTQFKAWSEENRGTASITCRDIDELCFMDRITLSEVTSIFNETVHLKVSGSDLLFFTTYPIIEIEYLGLFISDDEPLQRLIVDNDYTFSRNIIVLSDTFNTLGDDLTLTIRYKHNPQYHIIDLPRNTISTKVDNGGVEQSPVSLPIHAIGRYSHFVLDAENISGNRLFDNSFTEHTC